MVFPDFGQVFLEFTTPAECRKKKNRALLLFCTFCAITVGLLAARSHHAGALQKKRVFLTIQKMAYT